MNDALQALEKIVFKIHQAYDPRTQEWYLVVNGADTRMN